MPFFVVGVGIGANVIGKNDLNMFYQLLTLKIALVPCRVFARGVSSTKFQRT